MLASTRSAPAQSSAPLRLSLVLLAALVCLLLGAPAALAGTPGDGHRQGARSGAAYEALTPLTQVTTTTAPSPSTAAPAPAPAPPAPSNSRPTATGKASGVPSTATTKSSSIDARSFPVRRKTLPPTTTGASGSTTPTRKWESAKPSSKPTIRSCSSPPATGRAAPRRQPICWASKRPPPPKSASRSPSP